MIADHAITIRLRLIRARFPPPRSPRSARFRMRRVPFGIPVPGMRPTRPRLGASPADLSKRWLFTERFTSLGFMLEVKLAASACDGKPGGPNKSFFADGFPAWQTLRAAANACRHAARHRHPRRSRRNRTGSHRSRPRLGSDSRRHRCSLSSAIEPQAHPASPTHAPPPPPWPPWTKRLRT